MILTDKDYSTIWGEALAAPNRDVYVSEWSTSSIWADGDDLLEVAAYLGQLWDVAHMSVRDIRTAAGLTQAAMAATVKAPVYTLPVRR